jgi:hypothetical protein
MMEELAELPGALEHDPATTRLQKPNGPTELLEAVSAAPA